MTFAFIVLVDEVARHALKTAIAAIGFEAHARGRTPVLENAPDGVAPMDEFGDLAEWIEGLVERPGELTRALGFIDVSGALSGSPIVRRGGRLGVQHDGAIDYLDPLHTNGAPWTRVVGALVLAFPEVHWVFVGDMAGEPLDGEITGDQPLEDALLAAHVLRGAADLPRIMNFHRGGYLPLFNPAGLRQSILRAATEGESPSSDALDAVSVSDHHHRASRHSVPAPIRRELAIVLDDEEVSAFELAFMAFRFGYRALAVMTSRLALELLRRPVSKPIGVSFEDMYLSFPDKGRSESYSKLEDRKHRLSVLGKVGYRVFVTVGREFASDTGNEQFIANCTAQGTGIRILKPLDGSYATWMASGMWERNRATNGYPQGFFWPPHGGAAASRSHSAPGMALLIAEALDARARSIGDDVRSVNDALHGAVLAIQSQELLQGKTPSTALEAFVLQHDLEAAADAASPGNDYTFDLDLRIADIQRTATAYASRFHDDKTESVRTYAIRGVLDRMAKRFHDANQFDEELRCLGESRLHYGASRVPWYLERRRILGAAPSSPRLSLVLGFLQWGLDRCAKSIGSLFMSYFFWTIFSLERFVVAVCGWVLMFAVLLLPFNWMLLVGIVAVPLGLMIRAPRSGRARLERRPGLLLVGVMVVLYVTATVIQSSLPWSDLVLAISRSARLFVGLLETKEEPWGCTRLVMEAERLWSYFHLGILASALYTRVERR